MVTIDDILAVSKDIKDNARVNLLEINKKIKFIGQFLARLLRKVNVEVIGVNVPSHDYFQLSIVMNSLLKQDKSFFIYALFLSRVVLTENIQTLQSKKQANRNGYMFNILGELQFLQKQI